MIVAKQFQDRMVVKDRDTGLVHTLAHEAHVVRTAQVGDIEVAILFARKGIAPFDELQEVFVGAVSRAQHPATIGKAGSALETLLDRGCAPFSRRHTPRSRVGRSRGTARAVITLVSQDDARAGLGSGKRRPGGGGAPTDNQHVRFDVAPVFGGLFLATRCHDVPVQKRKRWPAVRPAVSRLRIRLRWRTRTVRCQPTT